MDIMITRTLILLGVAWCGVKAGAPVSSCQDLDTQACQLFSVAKPDLCTDPAFAFSTCKRYCGNCPLECYSCPTPVLDPNDCNTTNACTNDSTCITKHLLAIDGHHEFIMSCERQGICEGLTFGFGKRDINDLVDVKARDRYERDVTLSCCDTDFCNFPFLTTTTTTPATTTPNIAACYKDIVFVVDDSGSVGNANFRQAIDFIRQIVNRISVGPNHAHVAVMAYSTHPQIEWNLKDYTTKTGVLNALHRVPYMSGITKTGDALEAVRTQMFTANNGDRIGAGNAVVVLTDGNSNNHVDTIHEANNLHMVAKDVVSIVVGHGINMAELNAIATDRHHVFDIHTYANLYQIAQQIINLVCG